MKILVVVDSINIEDSSGSKANVALIHNLVVAGYDVLVYKDTISTTSEVSEIHGIGNYMVRFNLADLGRNKNTTTIIISIK